MKRRQRCTATVHTVRADPVNIRTRLQITTRSKPCIEKSSGCPRGIKRPSCSATSKGSRTKRRLGGSVAGSARSVRKCPAQRTAAPPARSPRAGLPGRNCRCRDRLDKALGAPERAGRFHRQERDVCFHRARGRERPGLDRQSFPGSLEIHAIRENRTDLRRAGRPGSRCHRRRCRCRRRWTRSAAGTTTTARARAPALNPEPIAVAAAAPQPKAEEEPARETELIVRSATNLKRIADGDSCVS